MEIEEYQEIYKKYRAKSFRSSALITYFANHYDLTKVNKIIDVGCGIGRSLPVLHKMGLDAIGVEVSEKSIEKARKNTGGTIVMASACDLSMFRDKEFDIYLSADVFEHLSPEDIDQSISEAMRITSQYILFRVHPVMDKRKKYHLTIMPLVEWEQKWLDAGVTLLDRVDPNGFIFKIGE